ncbi:MAG: hypothetical protein WA160_11390 [Pseudobdellovibrio sp.]
MRFLLLLVGSFSFCAQAQSLIRCEALFLSKSTFEARFNPEKLNAEQAKAFLQSTDPDKNSGSTTGDRAEYKYTLTQETILRKISQLKDKIESEILGFKLVNRDLITAGFKNVTWTGYSNRLKLPLSTDTAIVAKIRVRKYGHVDDLKAVSKENFTAIESMKDVSYFEFKIENPDHDNSVLKPRVKILDADANALLNPKISSKDYKKIAQRCVNLNKMKTDQEQKTVNQTIVLMLKAISMLRSGGSYFAPEYETIYERISYKIPLKNIHTNQVYEVQITVDENITASSISFDFKSTIYNNKLEDLAVTEVKVPIDLLQLLKSKDYDSVPGLKSIDDFLKILSFNNLKDFEENHGKLFHLRREIKNNFMNLFESE